LLFDSARFIFTTARPQNIAELAREVQALWDIVSGNLGLRELIRVGCRLDYYLATKSLEEAEEKLSRAALNIRVPDQVSARGYKVKFRGVTVTFVRDAIEYRVLLQTATRHEAVPASNLIATEPRTLSKHQREARLAAIKQKAAYEHNPEMGINLDVDCSVYEPTAIQPVEFIVACHKTVENDFVPLLKT
jgi:hypothetical protein